MGGRTSRQKMAAGEIVEFQVDEGDRYSLPVTIVHIVGLELEMETAGTQNIRKYAVTLKEK
ncbi:MAG: hypothetical protein QXR13_00670 [Candidatus Bathyarchaeia archaeon]